MSGMGSAGVMTPGAMPGGPGVSSMGSASGSFPGSPDSGRNIPAEGMGPLRPGATGPGGGPSPVGPGGADGRAIERGQAGGGDINSTFIGFGLKNIKAEDAAKILNNSLRDKGIRVIPDPKLNAIYVTGDPAALQQVRGVVVSIIEENHGKIEGASEGGRIGEGSSGSSAGGPPMFGPIGGSSSSGMSPTGGGPLPGEGGSAPMPSGEIKVLTLKNAVAADMSVVLEKVFLGKATITPEPRSNQLIVQADQETMMAVAKLLQELDVPAVKKP